MNYTPTKGNHKDSSRNKHTKEYPLKDFIFKRCPKILFEFIKNPGNWRVITSLASLHYDFVRSKEKEKFLIKTSCDARYCDRLLLIYFFLFVIVFSFSSYILSAPNCLWSAHIRSCKFDWNIIHFHQWQLFGVSFFPRGFSIKFSLERKWPLFLKLKDIKSL